MNNCQVKTLCKEVNDKINIRLDCVTDTETNEVNFVVAGQVR